MHRKSAISGVPALKRDDGTWERTAVGKASLISTTLSGKYVLPPVEENLYSWRSAPSLRGGWLPIRLRWAMSVLKELSVDSATGPDALAARVLRECRDVLAHAVVRLARRIVATHRWPNIWVTHWIVPLFKRGSVFDAANYRGIHLTAQLSKVIERLLGRLFVPTLERVAFGKEQFAYRRAHGARDALALYVIRWIHAFNRGRKIALYCSDVLGAFDRVSSQQLLDKLSSCGIHTDVLGVLASWLRSRPAFVLVGGAKSEQLLLANMVFQGTVWGPPLWNAFFGDSVVAIRSAGFDVIIYADDLNAFREYDLGIANDILFANMRACQAELHTWGRANQVVFDAGKEHMIVLSHQEPSGAIVKLLGVKFDAKLSMNIAIHECVVDVGWKCRTLLRTQRFYTHGELLGLWKSHILSFIEYRTPAWYHACETALRPLDNCLSSFLRKVGIDDLSALTKFNLAPLRARRDIAMLAVIHRAVLRLGPPVFQQFVVRSSEDLRRTARVRRHSRQLLEYRDSGRKLNVMRRSFLGLISVYNLLPEHVVSTACVCDFQAELQDMLKVIAVTGHPQWQYLFSPRLEFAHHPLKEIG